MSIGYYEVFLNFRGRDTRTGFTDHLYNGLVDAGISVFRDDNELRQGEEIRPDLLTAIRNSKILIPIISVNYGQSRWCLDELVQIMECKKSNMGYTVLPIFYKVQPSHVRTQKGSFGDAFRTHSKYFDSTTLEKWKQSLDEVSSLKGHEANGYEGELVKLIVRQVLSELKKKFELVIPENLVGIDSHVKKVMEFVDNISRASLFVGIHGMGGIGKTTLAKIIYNKLLNQFEHHSFIADVRERGDDRRLVYLQNQLIKDILKLENQVSSNDEGIRFISSRFNGKKVLILLDDVSNDYQLKALAGNHNWFSSGSVIIITTRNRSILGNVGVDNQYELEQLDKDNSLILFSRHAFRRDSPLSEFKDLTRDVVSTTGGLPLSLEVLGSFLCGKNKKLWGEVIKKLRKVPERRVREKLRISYDELTHEQKQIFLDIACFFINTDLRIASYMWDACDFFPEQGIDVLRFMSLIKVGDNHKLSMHDQLRDLGREIIREENYSEPWNRSRLWDSKDVLEVLEGNKGTNKIEALRLDSNYEARLDLGYETKSYMAETFKELTKLRLLQLEDVHLTGDFRNFFPQLRWLKQMDYHPNFELTNFHLKKLVVLDLSWSNILEDWGGWSLLKMATKLKVLNLSNCSMRTTPDLSAFKSLEILILEDCDHLEEIHPSIENINTLVSLNVSCCWELKKLPLGVDRMEKSNELLITDNDIQEVPISRGCLTKPETLNVSSCRWLAQLPESSSSIMSLTQLDLSDTRFEELPESIGSLKKLETLNASYCELLAHIPISIGDLASLSRLDLTNCETLAQLPDSIGSLVSLSQLLLSGCHSLRQIPDSIGKLTSLTELHLKSTAIEELPISTGSLQKLKTLDASCCASLAYIPNSIGNLVSLSCLNLTNCQKLAQLPDSIGSLMSLPQLLLSGCHSLRRIPDSIGKLTSLIELNLKSTAIEELPESIGNMQNLRMLDISGTPIIELLDDQGILAKLQGLRASGWKNLDGPPNGQLVSPNNLDFDKLQKLSELHSRILALVLLKRPKIAPTNSSTMNYRLAYSEHVLQRSRPFGISNEDSESMANVKPGIADESGDKSRIWRLTEINEPLQCRSIRLPDDSTATRVSRLIYTNSGLAILALSSNAVHKLWKWGRSDRNLTGRATTSVVPQLWRPASGILMTNDVRDTNPKDAVPCFALSKNDCYGISASGGKISLFNMMSFEIMTTFLPPLLDNDGIVIEMEDSTIQIDSVQIDEIQTKLKGHRRIIKGFAFSTSLHVLVSSGADSQTMTTFTPPPPRPTFLAFYPQDNNIIAIGMDDSSIRIYYVRVDEFKANLKGHQKRITGLAFSNVLNVLVSSGADSQLCVWSNDGWEKQASQFLQMPTGLGATPLAGTRLQFHVDQIHLLVVHETQIATYEAPKLECVKQWVPREASGPITDATYSCNGQSIYVSFEDGSIGVLTTSTLRLRCHINPAAYIRPKSSFTNDPFYYNAFDILRVYPLVIAAHPSKPNQFALGLTDGSVYVLEPLESKGEWGDPPPVENGVGPSTTFGATGSDQPQR